MGRPNILDLENARFSVILETQGALEQVGPATSTSSLQGLASLRALVTLLRHLDRNLGFLLLYKS